MNRQDLKTYSVDERALALSIASPKEKDYIVAIIVEVLDHSVGELFPSLVSMRIGIVGANAETCVEQKHALTGPAA